MKELKKSPRQQLEKFSTIFMQLGLVLVLFVVFISLEHKTEHTAVVLDFEKEDYTTTVSFDNPIVYEREVIKKVKPKVEVIKQITKILEKPKVVTDNVKVINSVIEPTDNIPEVSKDLKFEEKIEEENISDDDDPKPVSIDYVTKIPVFKGCEELDEKEGRKCFEKKMNKLVKRHFNAGLANELGLKRGKNKILTQFVIDKTGNVVDVKIRAPHNRLERETKRVINKIPSFIPGETNGKPANVRYTLPINFQVE